METLSKILLFSIPAVMATYLIGRWTAEIVFMISIHKLERQRKKYERETERLIRDFKKKSIEQHYREGLKKLTEDFHQN